MGGAVLSRGWFWAEEAVDRLVGRLRCFEVPGGESFGESIAACFDGQL